MKTLTGVTIRRPTMRRQLKRLGVTSRMVKAIAPCPWSAKARNRGLKRVRRRIARFAPDEACVWEDETDIDLNPRLGRDGMPRGVRREVVTPGKNVKHPFATALDATTGRVAWVEGPKKNRGLFLALLKKRLTRYADKRKVHVILDHFKIHAGKQVRAWRATRGARIRLHFLPPSSPDDHRVEAAVWRPMHAAVTDNHRESRLPDLDANVKSWLIRADRAALRSVAESRKAV